MSNKAFLIGIIGGLGLGLLVGSELPGSFITIVGAVLLAFSIIVIIIALFMGREAKLESESALNKKANAFLEQSYDERRRESKNNEKEGDSSIKERNRIRFIKR